MLTLLYLPFMTLEIRAICSTWNNRMKPVLAGLQGHSRSLAG